MTGVLPVSLVVGAVECCDSGGVSGAIHARATGDARTLCSDRANTLLMDRANISGTNFRTAFVLLLVLGVTVLFIAVAWPFLKPLLLGAMLAGLCRPLYHWITRMVGGRRSLAAGITLIV